MVLLRCRCRVVVDMGGIDREFGALFRRRFGVGGFSPTPTTTQGKEDKEGEEDGDAEEGDGDDVACLVENGVCIFGLALRHWMISLCCLCCLFVGVFVIFCFGVCVGMLAVLGFVLF